MPHGIDEAFFPRFSSEEGREIGPVLTDEGAREVAVYTAVPRALFSGGKLNDFFAKRCVADKDPLSFLRFEALVIISQPRWHATWQQASPCLLETLRDSLRNLVSTAPRFEFKQQFPLHFLCTLPP